MAKLPICKYGAPVLRRRCPEVKEITGDIRKILEDMRQTMYEEDGVGLAASQVGEAKRLIVLDGGGGLWQLINPRIISRRDEGTSLEGCLSLPGVTVKINRSQEVTVEALNKKGEKIIVEGKGLLSYILQHEIDHLALKLRGGEEFPVKPGEYNPGDCFPDLPMASSGPHPLHRLGAAEDT